MAFRFMPFLVLPILASQARADGPADNIPAKVRPIPPKGIVLKEADRSELQAGLDLLAKEVQAAQVS